MITILKKRRSQKNEVETVALLQDLIQQIDDPTLRDRILQETDKLIKQKKFGLVFEEHLPECTPLYDVPIRVGSKVALKTGYVSDIYTVVKIDSDKVLCDRRETHEQKIFKLDEIVDALVRYQLSRIRVSAKDSLIAEQHEKAAALARSRYKMSAMRLEEKQKELSDYEAETINVIRGKSRLNVDLLNSLVAKCKEEIAELSQEVDAQKADMERQLESAAQEQAEFEKLESWADLYDNCTFEAKKMIVSQLIKAVYVYRDYRLEVEFRVSFADFRRLCVGCEPNGGRIATVESV